MRKKGNLAYLLADLQQGPADPILSKKLRRVKTLSKITKTTSKCPQCGGTVFYDILLQYKRCDNWRCDFRTYS